MQKVDPNKLDFSHIVIVQPDENLDQNEQQHEDNDGFQEEQKLAINQTSEESKLFQSSMGTSRFHKYIHLYLRTLDKKRKEDLWNLKVRLDKKDGLTFNEAINHTNRQPKTKEDATKAFMDLLAFNQGEFIQLKQQKHDPREGAKFQPLQIFNGYKDALPI